MIRRLFGALGIATLVAIPAFAQAKPGVAISPFFGVTIPMQDLLLRPGLVAGVDQEKQSVLGVVGGRISVGLSPRIELEAELGYGTSGLKISTLSSPSGTDVKLLTMSGRIAYRVKPVIEPFWLTVQAGVGAVNRKFSENSGLPSAIGNKTNVGGVIGTTLGFRATDRLAVVIGVDAFVYNASFDVAATGSQPAGTTQSLTQTDLRLSLGVRVPLLGL